MGLLQLGSFQFDIDDLPSQMPLGGEQLLVVNKYPGGVKDIQAFGTFDDPVVFTGTFNYTAEKKVAQIDKMYRSGGQYPLKIGSFKTLTVVIRKFNYIYNSPSIIDYSIELEVLKSTFTSTKSKTGSASVYSTKVVSSPPKSNAPAPRRVYIVEKNDTLWGISKKYYGTGTLHSKISAANKLKSTIIHVGQRLIIP